MQQIPVTNDARQTFLTTLNDVTVRLTIWYQSVGGSWILRLETPEGRVITDGAKLNPGRSALAGIIDDFIGEIVVVPTESPVSDLSRNPWGNTHILVFMSPEEAVEAGIAAV